MAGIYERVTNTGEDGEAKIPVHDFMAGLREVARGHITMDQVKTAFNLDATAGSEVDAIAVKYNGLSTDMQREDFKTQLHDALLLAESGFYDKATVKDRLGF